MLSKFATQSVTKAAQRSANARTFAAMSATWSGDLSFTSPESDFYASSFPLSENDSSKPVWSETLSFASPESDFTHSHGDESLDVDSRTTSSEEWSQSLSFASPEADFVSEPNAPDWEWSEEYSFSSPESDFQSISFKGLQQQEVPIHITDSSILNLAISCPESAYGSVHAHNFLQSRQLVQLHEKRIAAEEQPLPRTWEEAFGDTNDTRAIVATEINAPFRIAEVNDAWVGLCGFSKAEARDRTLALIQGQDTNTHALDSMLYELLHGHETTTLVTNYAKNGRKFYNFLRAGPIKNENNEVTHFVGVLQEVTEQPDYFHMAA